MALYLTCVYGDATLASWFREAYADAGKHLDMGKSCLRFTKLEDLPLDVLGQTIAKVPVDDFIASYEKSRAQTAGGKRAASAKRTKSAVRSKSTASTSKSKKKAKKAKKAKAKTTKTTKAKT